MPDTSDTSNTSAPQTIRMRHEQLDCDTSATRATQVRHECYTNDMSVIRVKTFDFDNDTSEKIFSQSYISSIADENLQGEEPSHSEI